MFVYSKKIIQFISDIKCTVKYILSKEIQLKISGNRFYNSQQTASYPISIVVYNNKKMLGYFDPHFYQLGFHEQMMHAKKETLQNLIRHELAHFMTFINFGDSVLPHGHEFRKFCDQMKWGEEIYKATLCLEEQGKESPWIEESTILRKIQKLMALASSSSNNNEAESAILKSQQLLLKHNIEFKYFDENDDEKIFVKRIMKQKKENAKMRSIAKILETFFVSVIYNRGGGYIYLEILGNSVNIEIAEYVASFLESEMENLWVEAQQTQQLKGAVAKNSFFLGLAKGYCNKIQALKNTYTKDEAFQLMVIEKKLVDQQALVYRNLKSTKSQGNHCRQSSLIGELMGNKLTINPAVENTSKKSILALISKID